MAPVTAEAKLQSYHRGEHTRPGKNYRCRTYTWQMGCRDRPGKELLLRDCGLHQADGDLGCRVDDKHSPAATRKRLAELDCIGRNVSVRAKVEAPQPQYARDPRVGEAKERLALHDLSLWIGHEQFNG
jgi:hypothetical protein